MGEILGSKVEKLYQVCRTTHCIKEVLSFKKTRGTYSPYHTIKMDAIQKLILERFYDLKPEDYEPCEHCKGYGSSLGESCPTCSVCGGKGVVLKWIKTK